MALYVGCPDYLTVDHNVQCSVQKGGERGRGMVRQIKIVKRRLQMGRKEGLV